MKTCPFCGKKYTEGHDVCPYCQGKPAFSAPAQKPASEKTSPKNNILIVGIVIGVLVGAALAALLITLLGNNAAPSDPVTVPVVTPVPEGTGSLSGLIVEASDRTTAVGEATVNIYAAQGLTDTTSSNDDGRYSATLDSGRYSMVVSKPEYIDYLVNTTVIGGENNSMETILLIKGQPGEVGSAAGTVFDSTTGKGVPEADLDFLKGANSYVEGVTDLAAESLAHTKTDANGKYTIDLPLGNYTVVMQKENFMTHTFNLIVQKIVTENQNGTITPEQVEEHAGDYLITLTWGVSPRDVDSHMSGATAAGNTFHVYWNNKRFSRTDDPVFCELDVDDVTSYGPEHITLVSDGGTYYYYLHRYSSDSTLAASESKVTIEQGNQLIRTFYVPTDQIADRYWNIFAIKNGQLIVKNTMTPDAPDLTYAND
ncbi:MAG: carboxypeptidase regulatory-like domain-containing protein [Clostridia bacterium]|nr:carboxypeptidase regulatory-like domain-containing protein [Clostridia bacterium]